MKNICLLITLFIVSTLLVAAEPLDKKTKPVDKRKGSQLNKVKPTKEKGETANIVKPMKKRAREVSGVRVELERLRKKFEYEKLAIQDDFKKDLKMLKGRKKEALKDLKLKFQKERASLRKRD